MRALLAAAGAEASRPEDLPTECGLLDGGYQLTEVQAKEILEMRLNRLTGLEQEKLTDEYQQLLETIRGLIDILENPDRAARGDPHRAAQPARKSSATSAAPRSAPARKTSTSST